jgi:hypothetical protein
MVWTDDDRVVENGLILSCHDKTKPALLKALEQGNIQPTAQQVQDMVIPPSDEALEELDHFFL